jgi:hypothetical protein
MPQITGSIDIGCPVEDVFAYLKVPENNLEWEKGVIVNELTTEGPIAAGSKGRRVEKHGMTDEGIWEITKYEENRTLVFEFESQKFYGEGSWELESADGGTRVSYGFLGIPKSFVFKLLMPIMMLMVRRQVRRDYEKLKQVLEAGA